MAASPAVEGSSSAEWVRRLPPAFHVVPLPCRPGPGALGPATRDWQWNNPSAPQGMTEGPNLSDNTAGTADKSIRDSDNAGGEGSVPRCSEGESRAQGASLSSTEPGGAGGGGDGIPHFAVVLDPVAALASDYAFFSPNPAKYHSRKGKGLPGASPGPGHSATSSQQGAAKPASICVDASAPAALRQPAAPDCRQGSGQSRLPRGLADESAEPRAAHSSSSLDGDGGEGKGKTPRSADAHETGVPCSPGLREQDGAALRAPRAKRRKARQRSAGGGAGALSIYAAAVADKTPASERGEGPVDPKDLPGTAGCQGPCALRQSTGAFRPADQGSAAMGPTLRHDREDQSGRVGIPVGEDLAERDGVRPLRDEEALRAMASEAAERRHQVACAHIRHAMVPGSDTLLLPRIRSLLEQPWQQQQRQDGACAEEPHVPGSGQPAQPLQQALSPQMASQRSTRCKQLHATRDDLCPGARQAEHQDGSKTAGEMGAGIGALGAMEGGKGSSQGETNPGVWEEVDFVGLGDTWQAPLCEVHVAVPLAPEAHGCAHSPQPVNVCHLQPGGNDRTAKFVACTGVLQGLLWHCQLTRTASGTSSSESSSGGWGASVSAPLFETAVANPSEECEALALVAPASPYLLPPASTFLISDAAKLRALLEADAFCRGPFNLILVDPPWENKSVKRRAQYPTIPSRHFLSLPIRQLADPERGCLLALWVTNRERLRRFVDGELLDAWGARHVATWYWLKATRAGELLSPLSWSHHRPYEVLLLCSVPPRPGAGRPSPPAGVPGQGEIGCSRVDIATSAKRLKAEHGPAPCAAEAPGRGAQLPALAGAQADRETADTRVLREGAHAQVGAAERQEAEQRWQEEMLAQDITKKISGETPKEIAKEISTGVPKGTLKEISDGMAQEIAKNATSAIPKEVLLSPEFGSQACCQPPDGLLIASVPGEHSRKPPIHDLLELFAPMLGNEKCNGRQAVRAVELFAREMRHGWMAWGKEPLLFQHLANFEPSM